MIQSATQGRGILILHVNWVASGRCSAFRWRYHTRRQCSSPTHYPVLTSSQIREISYQDRSRCSPSPHPQTARRIQELQGLCAKPDYKSAPRLVSWNPHFGLWLNNCLGTLQSSYLDLSVDFGDVLPDSDHMLLLIHALGSSDVPDLLLRSTCQPQRRWNDDGHIQKVEALEFGLDPELVRLLSDDNRRGQAIAQPGIL